MNCYKIRISLLFLALFSVAGCSRDDSRKVQESDLIGSWIFHSVNPAWITGKRNLKEALLFETRISFKAGGSGVFSQIPFQGPAATGEYYEYINGDLRWRMRGDGNIEVFALGKVDHELMLRIIKKNSVPYLYYDADPEFAECLVLTRYTKQKEH